MDKVTGKHVYGNLYNCNEEVISDEEKLKNIVAEAAKKANATLWEIKSWMFKGEKGGISIIALVVESHIALHTWPKFRFATVDIYTCGEETDPWKAFEFIISQLKPGKYTVNYVDRSSR